MQSFLNDNIDIVKELLNINNFFVLDKIKVKTQLL